MRIFELLRTRPRAKDAAVTDDELMRQIQSGSRDAYLMIYDRYENAVFAYCRRVVADADRAADVFQEAFVRVWTKSASYHGGNFEAWLFMIVRNLCRDDHHDRSRHTELDLVVEHVHVEEGPDMMERAALVAALEKLPAELREAIVLREYEGFSYQEIAALTGQSLSSVGVRIFRAKQQLRISLAPFQDNDR